MVRWREAALASGERTGVILVIRVVTRAGPGIAISRVRRPQVVQITGQRERECGLVALRRQLHTEVPEYVAHDIIASAAVAVNQESTTARELRKGLCQTYVVVLYTGVPRLDLLDFDRRFRFAGAVVTLRTIFANIVVDVLAGCCVRHGLAIACHYKVAHFARITEPEGIVPCKLTETNLPGPAVETRRAAALASSELAIFVLVIFVVTRADPGFVIH